LKGADILIRAWGLFAKTCPGAAQLVIVGDGPEREAVGEIARELRVGDSVEFCGFQEDVRAYYQAADIFVLPSRTEGFSNALREAMACALPVIASNAGGTPDVVREGVEGLLFESESEQALASCLERLVRDQAFRRTLGEQACQTVTETGGSALMGNLRDAYLELLSRNGLAPAAAQQART
jgi:glycosyltransferase involved in cell wall biosynthesis